MTIVIRLNNCVTYNSNLLPKLSNPASISDTAINTAVLL